MVAKCIAHIHITADLKASCLLVFLASQAMNIFVDIMCISVHYMSIPVGHIGVASVQNI